MAVYKSLSMKVGQIGVVAKLLGMLHMGVLEQKTNCSDGHDVQKATSNSSEQAIRAARLDGIIKSNEPWAQSPSPELSQILVLQALLNLSHSAENQVCNVYCSSNGPYAFMLRH